MILFVGNILSKHGFNPTYFELLAHDLDEYQIFCTSDKKNKILRLLYMIVMFYKNIFNIKLLVIDTYSTHSYYFALIISMISRFHRKPYILNLSGGDLENRLINTNSFKTILKHSALNISPSKFIYEKFQTHHIKSLYIPNYLNLKLYPYYRRSSFGPRLLWVRSFHKIYNPEMAIETVRLLHEKYPDINLCMVGPTKDNSIVLVKRLAEHYNLIPNLILTGRISKNKIVELSTNFDIFINTTNFDNLPISVLEAMALGLPIISTNVGGLPFFLNNENSILVNQNDSIAMADAIIQIIESPKFGVKISDNARKTVEENHNKNIIMGKWSKIFDNYL